MPSFDSSIQENLIEPTPSAPTETRSLPENNDILIAAKAVSLYVGLATQTFSRLRCERRGPPFVRLGRRVFYKSGDLKKWIDANRVFITDEKRVGSMS